jgi:hypothetical protein
MRTQAAGESEPFSNARRRKKGKILIVALVLLAFYHPIALGMSSAIGLTMFGRPMWLGFLEGFAADIWRHVPGAVNQ